MYCGKGLPIQTFAQDNLRPIAKPRGITHWSGKKDGGVAQIIIKGKTGWPERVLVTKEPNNLWDVEDKLMEEGDVKVLD
jgi:hypothetical protein